MPTPARLRAEPTPARRRAEPAPARRRAEPAPARLRAIVDDITTVEVDAIVNAANRALLGGGGVDGAIHRAGGPDILAACRETVARQGECEAGEAVITGAGRLPARHVIHTVGPIWTPDRAEAHDATLASAYTSSLRLADHHGLATIAFPNISTGVYGFPKERAAGVAIAAVRDYLAASRGIEQVTFVCFDEDNHHWYQQILG